MCWRHFLVVLLMSCAPGVPEPYRGSEPSNVMVVAAPEVPLTSLPSVFRLRLDSLPQGKAEQIWLFSGELSRYDLRRIRGADLTKTLISRHVPTLSYQQGKEWIVAPSRPLEPGRYSLAAAFVGLLAPLTVIHDGRPLIRRLWPPREASRGRSPAIYCVEEGELSPLPATLEFSPGGQAIPVTAGAVDPAVQSRRCLSAKMPQGSSAELPPIEVDGLPLDPAPLPLESGDPLLSLSCHPGQLPATPGCIDVQDDRLIVHPPSGESLWAFAWEPSLSSVVSTTSSFVVRGFQADTPYALSFSVLDASGLRSQVTQAVVTRSPQPHVVINEVYANAIGSEPSQEWIEVVNDGSTPIKLQGYTLHDAGGVTVLPAASLAPRQFALIVGEDYDAGAGSDLGPAPGTQLIVVPRVGKNGLSNSGEYLELKTPQGVVTSRFPATPKPKSGVSVARRRPDALFGVEGSFGLSEDPGASPGMANRLRE